MAQVDGARTTRGDDALGQCIDDTVAGRPTYPSGTTFISTEIEGFGQCVAEEVLRGVPIVIEYPDGEERFLVPRPHPRETTGPLRRLGLRWRR